MISGRLNAPTPIGLIVNAGVVNSWVLISGRVNLSTEIPPRDHGWMTTLGRVKGVTLIAPIEKPTPLI